MELKRSRRELDDERDPTFLHLEFTEAIAHFQGRRLVDPDAFAELTDEERFRAFSMSRAMSERVIERAKEHLNASMQPGGPGLREFIAAVQADEVALGFTPNHPGYLENVYRTSTATSYGAGRLRQQLDPSVVAATGYWEYLTAGDNRVRDPHAALEGSQWAMSDPAALQVYPPNGYQCRCVMVAIDASEVDQRRLMRSVPSGAIQDGFAAPPDSTISQEASEA